MKKYLLLLGLFILFPFSVNAASANIDISASSTKASLGNTIDVTVTVSSTSAIGYYEYTLDYDHSKLELTSGNAYNVEHSNSENNKKFEKKFEFKVRENGANKISVKSYAVSNYSGSDNMSVTINPVSINSSNSSDQSDNNYLSKLEIEGYNIEPKFNKTTNNYVLQITDEITDINVIAEADSSKASVIGTGKRTIKSGDNRIEVTVTSESGKDKTYTIKVTLKEKNPIKVTIDEKEYTLMRKIESYDDMNGYKIKKIKIDGEEVESLYNEKTNYTLLLLKDSNGNTSFYIYDDGKYTKYNVISSLKMDIIPVKTEEKLENYTLYKETINNSLTQCYKINSESNYCVIYAMDLSNGNKDWYMYDLENNTIQKFNSDIDDYYKDKMNNTVKLIYILSATTLLFGITTIAFAVKSGRKKK